MSDQLSTTDSAKADRAGFFDPSRCTTKEWKLDRCSCITHTVPWHEPYCSAIQVGTPFMVNSAGEKLHENKDGLVCYTTAKNTPASHDAPLSSSKNTLDLLMVLGKSQAEKRDYAARVQQDPSWTPGRAAIPSWVTELGSCVGCGRLPPIPVSTRGVKLYLFEEGDKTYFLDENCYRSESGAAEKGWQSEIDLSLRDSHPRPPTWAPGTRVSGGTARQYFDFDPSALSLKLPTAIGSEVSELLTPRVRQYYVPHTGSYDHPGPIPHDPAYAHALAIRNPGLFDEDPLREIEAELNATDLSIDAVTNGVDFGGTWRAGPQLQ